MLLKYFSTHPVISGRGTLPLDVQVQQLWLPAVATGQVRIVVNPSKDLRWRTVEQYWILPSTRHARLLVPDSAAKVTASSLLSYRRLRQGRVNAARVALGFLARAGLPPALQRLAVQRRVVNDSHAAPESMPIPDLPLEVIGAALQGQETNNYDAGPGAPAQHLYAAIGIRLGDNRKPTLQLFNGDGKPEGYAKLAWDVSSCAAITAETAALESLSGLSSTVLVPRLLATGIYAGYPFLVTAPLPAEVRAVRGAVPAPSPAELYALCPISRRDRLSTTAHFQSLDKRLAGMDVNVAPVLLGTVRELMALLRQRDSVLPISERWHGDLVPWNTARDAQQRLWIWDWELSEPDAAVGLDALHWAFSVRREAGEAGQNYATRSLMEALDDSVPYLDAAAVPRRFRMDVAALYVAVVAERAMTLASRNGGWSASWIAEASITEMVKSALYTLRTSAGEPGS